MPEAYDDAEIIGILRDTQTIAMVGASPNPGRDSHGVMKYLQIHGYRVIPVNPTVTGSVIHGEKVYGSLAEVPYSYQLVDVFRRIEAIPGLVDEIIPLIANHNIHFLWMQLDIHDAAAAARARSAGLKVVMDRCMRIEHKRLL